MFRRHHHHRLAVLAIGAFALAAPAAGAAWTGGGGLGPGASASPPKASTSPAKTSGTLVQRASGDVSAVGGGISIVAQPSGLLRGQLRFSGAIPQADAGAVVEIERLGHQTGWRWAPTAHAAASWNGAFTVIWRANHIGRFAIRAVVASTGAASPAVTTTVYRPSLATLYGPRLWGRHTACGQVLRRTTIGVANRTLKCGTPVAIYYQGRTMVVPVIDRGPYAFGADWDLTMATAAAIGIVTTDTIGAVSLPSPPPWLAGQLPSSGPSPAGA